jgi:hypothetical protein
MMRECGFRKIFLGNLELGRTIADKLQQDIRRLAFDLYTHMVEEGVEVELFASTWYFSLCGSFVPLDAMHIFIDKFLKKGFSGVNELLLAMLIRKKEILMNQQDSQLMLEFSNQNLCDYAQEIDWEELNERADRLLLTPIEM